MAEYSVKEIKSLINEHTGVLEALKGADNARRLRENEMTSKLQGLASRDGFSSVVREGLNGGAVSLTREQQDMLRSFYQYRVTATCALRSKELLAGVQPRLDRELAAAKNCGGALRRLFSSSQQRAQAQSAAQFLTDLKGSEYWLAASELKSELDAAQKPDEARINADIIQNRAVYREMCDRILKGEKRLVSDISKLLASFYELQDRLVNSESEIARSRAAIADCAQGMKAQAAERILADVPVEELNRDKGGVRVKTLRDCGYANMADIRRATVHQLTDINGISPEGAREIKEIAESFASRSASSVHIRLSADDRTPQSTALVQAVCDYRAMQKAVKLCDELKRDYSEDVDASVKALESVGCGAAWLFCSESEREDVRMAYHYISSLLGGEYASTVNQTRDLLSGAARSTPDQAWNDFIAHTVEYINIIETIVPDALGNDDSVYGLPEELARKIAEQEVFLDGLSCTLRPYQTWGLKYILHQQRVLLGDEMGLGKTVQAIAAMVSLSNTGETHFVVVCPASVLSNWCREIGKFCALRVTKLHGATKLRALDEWKREGGVAVTTYETTGSLELDDEFRFSMMIVDEAHYVKNPEAIRSKSVRRLADHADRILFMTGTALENRVEEMLSLIKVLRPAVAEEVKSMAFMASAPQFREKIAPVYYRRKRADVLKELPELTDSREWCSMGREEERAYESAVLSKNYAAARRVSWNVDDIAQSSKANRLREIAAEAESEGRKLIVFSFFLDTIEKICSIFEGKCAGPINGSIPPRRRQEIIDEFDKAPAGTVLAAQIQSGGTGLNIQSASVVVLCEPQFKPSIENQAISRAYRMGQARNVLVYRLLCEDSVDEKITELLEQKQAVFDAFADDSSVARESMELDEKGFGEIMQEEYKRISEKSESVKTDPEKPETSQSKSE